MELTKVKATWISADRCYVLRWKDSATGQPRQQATAFRNRARNKGAAKKAAAALQAELNGHLVLKEMGGDTSLGAEWHVFCDFFERLHFKDLGDKSLQSWRTTRNSYFAAMRPVTIRDVTTPKLATYLDTLTGSAATRKTRLAWLSVALGKAEEWELIARRPKIPRVRGGSDPSAKRAVHADEMDKLILAVDKIRRRTRDADAWKRLLWGLWHSGLRVGELLELSWEPGGVKELTNPPPSKIETLEELPIIIFRKQKNRRPNQKVPVTRQFWEVVIQAASGQPGAYDLRRGLVFPMSKRRHQMNEQAVVRVVGKIGEAAGIVVDEATGRTATSTDIGRRALPLRLSKELDAPELAQWMRHSSADTTFRHYYRDDPQNLGRRVWGNE